MSSPSGLDFFMLGCNSYLNLYNLLHILYNDEYKEFFGFDISYLRDPLPTDIEYINNREKLYEESDILKRELIES